MIPPLRKVKTLSEDLSQVQSAVDNVINVFRSKQILDGRLISNILIETGTPKLINHGMGMEIRGWVIVRKNAEADVWETASVTPLRTLVLNSSADVTVSVWVF